MRSGAGVRLLTPSLGICYRVVGLALIGRTEVGPGVLVPPGRRIDAGTAHPRETDKAPTGSDRGRGG
jgi:hypothetical protein